MEAFEPKEAAWHWATSIVMRRYSRLRMRELLVWPRYRDVAMCLGVLLVLTSTMRSGAFGGDPQFLSEEKAAARAKTCGRTAPSTSRSISWTKRFMTIPTR